MDAILPIWNSDPEPLKKSQFNVLLKQYRTCGLHNIVKMTSQYHHLTLRWEIVPKPGFERFSWLSQFNRALYNLVSFTAMFCIYMNTHTETFTSYSKWKVEIFTAKVWVCNEKSFTPNQVLQQKQIRIIQIIGMCCCCFFGLVADKFN